MSSPSGSIRDRANRVRTIPLEDVLRAVGAEQDRHDKAKWHTERGVLSVTGMKFMNWERGSGGGGAIDLIIHLYDLRFLDALDWLSRHFPAAACGTTTSMRPRKTPLQLPPRDHRALTRVRRYLCHTRGLPADLITALIQSGRLYADNRSNAVFLLLGKEGRPVGAELRGTSPQRPWRGMAPGSRKDAGYFAVPAPHATAVVLCESAIDAISCAALHPYFYCISTAGARSNPSWLRRIVWSGEVYCAFDADRAGDLMANDMITRYPTVARLRPPLHDWNDVLTSQL